MTNMVEVRGWKEGIEWATVMALVSGLGAAVVGVVVVNHVLSNPTGSFDVIVVPPAVGASALLGGILWWRLVERPQRFSDGRAVAVGFLTGVLAHPLMWTLYFLAGPIFLPGGWNHALVMFEIILMFTAFSLLFSGFLTIIGGIACGLVVMRCRRLAQPG